MCFVEGASKMVVVDVVTLSGKGKVLIKVLRTLGVYG